MVLHINMPLHTSFLQACFQKDQYTLSPFFPKLVSSRTPPPPQNSQFSATATCLCHKHALCKEVSQIYFFNGKFAIS